MSADSIPAQPDRSMAAAPWAAAIAVNECPLPRALTVLPSAAALTIVSEICAMLVGRVTVAGKERDLSSREYVLLETFMRHPGHVLTREQLLSHVWGYDFDPGSNVVDVYVRYLRKKIGSDTIETVRGMGYRLRA